MRVTQHLLAQHLRMFLHLAGSVQAAPGVIEIDLILRVEPGVLHAAQVIQRAGECVIRMTLQKRRVVTHGKPFGVGRFTGLRLRTWRSTAQ